MTTACPWKWSCSYEAMDAILVHVSRKLLCLEHFLRDTIFTVCTK